MNQSERLSSIETLLGERASVAERDRKRIDDQFEKISQKLDLIELTVRANRAEHDKIVNRGWGIVAAVGAIGAVIGSAIKTLLTEWFK